MDPMKNNGATDLSAPTPVAEREMSAQERRARELVESIEREIMAAREAAAKERKPLSTAFPPKADTPDFGKDWLGTLEKRVELPKEEVLSEEPMEEAEVSFDDLVTPIPTPEFTEEDEDLEFALLDAEEALRAKKEEEIFDEDFQFLMDMDYEDELGSDIGFEKIRAYHESEMNGRISKGRRKRATVEFESQMEDTTFRREYARQKLGKIVRLAVAFLMLVLIMIYERPVFMARTFGGPFDGAAHPTAYMLLGVQLLLIDAAFFAKPLWEGFVRLVRFSPVDYSFPSVLVVATFVYHYILLLMPQSGYPVLYLSPAAFCLTLLALMELLNWYRESLAFDVIASRRQKYAFISRVSVGGERDAAKEKLLFDEEGGTEYFARPVGFVRNYFSNTAQHIDHHHSLGAQLLLALALGVAFGLVVRVGTGNALVSLHTVFATMLMTAPFASLFLTSLPMFFSAVLNQRGKSAIIGENPIAECAEAATIVLPDHEIFAVMEHEQFHLIDGCDIHTVTALSRALLEKIGSPLAEAFGVDESSRISPATLTITDVATEGVAACFDDKGGTILFGTVSYMTEHGVPVRGIADDMPRSVYNRLHCVAVNGRACALFLVRYQLRRSAKAMFYEMEKTGVPVAIRTIDPCVREEILARLLRGRKGRVRVIKPSLREMEIRTERVDSTIVSIGSATEAARAYAACRRIRSAGTWGKILQAFSLTLGAGLVVLLSIFHLTPGGLFITAWLFSWCVLYTVVSFLLLRRRDDENEEE